jgi:putative ATP-binding cassette transporter
MTTTAVPTESGDESTLAQISQFWGLLRLAGTRNKLILFSVLIVTVIIVNAVAQVRLNSWQGDFYDAISNRNLPVFYDQLVVYVILVAILLTLGYSQTWLHETLKVKLRAAVAYDLLDEWLRPKRAYRLPLAGEIGVHPDQRIQDDARRLTELSVDLGVGLVQSTLLLVSFIGVLWVLSAQVAFTMDGTSFTIPGYMVWAAIGYALIGSFLTWLVGKPLIRANTDLRAAEADFRFLLVRVDEHSEAVAIYRGEADERQDLGAVASRVFLIMQQIANNLGRLHWVTGGYGWIALIAPVVLAAPGYFSGALTFGALMMVIGAFFQVQTSLRWYVDRFPALAEWRATLQRVISYRTALVLAETLGPGESRIVYCDHPEGKLSIDDLHVHAPNGRIRLREHGFEVSPGERVLIAGTPRCGKSTFFRALAGLWIWGEGTLRLPTRGTVMFMPHRPYIPLDTLRGAVSYPLQPEAFTEEEVRAVLKRVRLDRLTDMLDKKARWDHDLTLDEQQRIAFARALLHKPAWIIQDEAMSELDDDSRKLAESIFKRDLAGTALVSIGKRSDDGNFYDRIFNLEATPPALKLPLRLSPQPPADLQERQERANAGY